MAENNLIVPDFDNDRDDSLKITLDLLDNVDKGLLIYLNGYIDTYNSGFFQKQITKAIDAGFINIIFSCANLTYVSSTGIGAFTTVYKMVKSLGGNVVLLEVTQNVSEVFQLLGFSQFFNMKDTLEQALAFFGKGEFIEEFSIFPKIFACPVCSKKLKATKAGRFRCSECKSILSINEKGSVSLG